MTTEQLEQLMQAHKCGFTISTCDDGYECELIDDRTGAGFVDKDEEIVGHGTGPSIVEAVYEALKSKLGSAHAGPALLGFTELAGDSDMEAELKRHSKDKQQEVQANIDAMFVGVPPYTQQ